MSDLTWYRVSFMFDLLAISFFAVSVVRSFGRRECEWLVAYVFILLMVLTGTAMDIYSILILTIWKVAQ